MNRVTYKDEQGHRWEILGLTTAAALELAKKLSREQNDVEVTPVLPGYRP